LKGDFLEFETKMTLVVDPILVSVDRKLCEAIYARLPRVRVFLTRWRRDSGRGERRRGLIDYGGHGERHLEISRASCISILQIVHRGRLRD